MVEDRIYKAKYPWEATPTGTGESAAESDNGNAICESQQYLLFEPGAARPARGNATYWCKERDGVLYRRQFFDSSIRTERCWLQAVNLADFPVERGIFRVDKLRLIRRPVKVTLGSYGFPDNDGPCGGTKVLRREERLPDGSLAQAVILSGHDHRGVARQMAMTCYRGWEKLDVIASTGTNPDSKHSLVIYASMESRKQYGSAEPYLLISQVITAEVSEQDAETCVFSDEEIFPMQEIHYEDTAQTGAYGTTTIHFRNGDVRQINFEGIEAAF